MRFLVFSPISTLCKMVYTGQQLSIAKKLGSVWRAGPLGSSAEVLHPPESQTTYVPTADLGISALLFTLSSRTGPMVPCH